MKPWVSQTNAPLYLGACCDWLRASSPHGQLEWPGLFPRLLSCLPPSACLPAPARPQLGRKGEGCSFWNGRCRRQASLGEGEGPRPEPNWEAGESHNGRSVRGRSPIPAVHFAREQAEVQTEQVTCPRSHGKQVTEVRLELWAPNFQPWVLAAPYIRPPCQGFGGDPAEQVI